MGWRVFVLCWAAYACIALSLGRDTNWDLRNYHFYNAFALVEGRLWRDLAPANSQTFLHPGLDLPFYALARSPLNWVPQLVFGLQAIYAGLLAFLALAITNLVCNGRAGRVSAMSLIVTLFGVTGAITVSEAGTTHNDLPAAALVLAGLLAILSGAEQVGRRSALLYLLGGCLGGAAIGLKLTTFIHAPALGLAAFIAARGPLRTRLLAACLVGLGGLAGFVVIYAPWGWYLWQRFAAPFGPYGNGVFRSPLFPSQSLYDPRFLPRSLGQALIAPLLWVRENSELVTEPSFADPRYAVAFLSGIALIGLALAPASRRSGRILEARSAGAVLAFMLLSYVLWLGAFGILRYAVAVEVLLGIPVWALSNALLGSRSRGAVVSVLAAALVACQAATIYPDWGRDTYRSQLGEPSAAVAAESVELPANSLVVMLWGAVTFMAPFLRGPEVRFSGTPHHVWAGNAGIVDAAKRLIAAHPGPVFAVLENIDEEAEQLGRDFGLPLDRAICTPLLNNLTDPVYLCRVR